MNVKRVSLGVGVLTLQTLLAASSSFSMELGIEYNLRMDDMRWSIAGSGGTPNILSELSWQDVKSHYGRITLDGYDRGYILKAHYGRGSPYSGKNQDSDYLGDNRTGEFSRSNNNSEEGEIRDWSLGFGYRLASADERFTLTPLVGYADSRQKFVMTDGYQTLSLPPQTQPLGPFSGLNSSYQATWDGWWGGLDIAYRVNDDLQVSGSMLHQWYDYYGEANWNLITAFNHPKSFEHIAEGTGTQYQATLHYRFSHDKVLRLHYRFIDYRSDSGTDRTFYSNGSVTSQPFNEAVWESEQIGISLTLPLYVR